YSRSREREKKSYKNENSYREYRKTSRNRRERSRERLSNNYNYRNSYDKNLFYNINYIQQFPIPIYYGNLPPRPIVRPWVPMRGQVPGYRHIGPSFPPQFITRNRNPPPNPSML
ncbi:uncharacterized protein LOC133665766, partial [Apis cerana]|uniref:uncharacterized protein LOC133665766 n=1 Tax=Apis cerana TaxID=7461 RepID=UPI002B22B013